MERHGALLLYFISKTRKAARNQGLGGPRRDHSIPTNSKKVKRISRRQKIFSETLFKSLLQTRFEIINFKFTSVFELRLALFQYLNASSASTYVESQLVLALSYYIE